jgi:hypothetical protein
MYSAMVNSPQTELASAITDTDTTIILLDASKLPDPPNLATIGVGETAETILYTGKSGNDLTGVTRGFQGVAKAWNVGAKVARYFTAYDHEAFRQNIEEAQTTANTHASRTDNPHNVTKSQVGLGNVDNVKQATKTEFDAHVAETVNWQRFKLTGDNGHSKVPPYYGDVNNLKDTGMYLVTESATNTPTPTLAVLLVYNQDGLHISQVWHAFWGGDPYVNRMYTRSSFDGGITWTSWAELITSRGGTLTGDLFIQSKWPAVWLIDTDINNRINILHDNSAFYVQLRDAAGNWIRDLLKLSNNGAEAQLGTNNIWHTGMLRINNGTLEYNDGSGWRAVAYDPTRMTPHIINAIGDAGNIAASSVVNILSLSGSGVLGQLEVMLHGSSVASGLGVELVIDGAAKQIYSQDGDIARSIYKPSSNAAVASQGGVAAQSTVELYTPIKFNSSLVVRLKNITSFQINFISWVIKGVYYT